VSTRVRSSPHLFRPVSRAFVAWLAVLLVGAALIGAPLEGPADPARSPNPARSAWFLVWIQELVSHDVRAIGIAVGLFAGLVGLAWLPLPPAERAEWFPRRLRAVTSLVLLAVAFVLALTGVGLFLRGANWRFAWPW
jgi:hypothetical protein